MSEFLPDNRIQGQPPTSQSVNSGQTSAAHSLKRLSISTASATPLPASSPRSSPASPARTLLQRNNSSNGSLPLPRSPLHRSPSAMSQNSRSSTPTLLRKASMNSLHGVSGVTPSRSSTPRRSSAAQFTNASAMVGKPPVVEEDTTPPPLKHTAASIASNFFKAELDLQNSDEQSSKNADTIAILHDSCYGHRYSRPRTSKASLSTIVERPERIHASILGLSVAYVRLGERHAEGQHSLHPNKDPSTIPTMPFKIQKTTRRLALSSQAVTNVHGVKWMEELKIMCDNAEARLAMNGKELIRPEMNRGADQDAPAKLHEGDLYLCAESLDAMEGALGAVCEGVDAVFQGAASRKGPHRAFVAIRPPGHHCSASYPSGFCWLNNVHVGISHAALAHGLTHAAIIDFDLHHGDGSQAIAWDNNKRAFSAPKNALPWKKTAIGYFSLHDINSYPCEMGDEEKVKNASLCIENAHGQSIWNVHLQPWKSEAEFWKLYEDKYSILLEKTRTFLRAQTERLRLNPNGPKAKSAIFLSAGFDASEWESSGMQRHKVNVPTEFYARLTRDVVKLAGEEGTAAEGRVISVLEGGYSDRALCTGVLSHLSGMAAGDPVIISKEISPNGLAYEMVQKIGAFTGLKDGVESTVTLGAQTYDPSWWSLSYLEQLDSVVNPPPAPVEPKKLREVTPTFSSPTQSFIAKVTSPNARRSVSAMSANGYSRPLSRVDSPPPEVDWTVAAHELSKLLIPIDRQTKSCRPEDLSAEATRARRDRQSILTPPTAAPEISAEPTGQRMALRTRKPAKALVESIEEDEAKKPISKASRRKTVAGAALIAAKQAMPRSTTPKPEPSYAKPTNQSSRRLSSASTTGSTTSEAPYANGVVRQPSNGTSHFQRSATSQSVRPDSSMSSRGHSIPPVVVKKTRAPVQPKPDVPKATRVRRKSPLNGEHGTMEHPLQPANNTTLPAAGSTLKTSDIDDLTSNMKKITLTLTTKAQREAREREKKAAAKSAPERKPKTVPLKLISKKDTPSLPSSKSRSTSRSQTPASIPETQPTTQQPSTPQLPATLPAHLQVASSIPLPASSPPVSPHTTALPPTQSQAPPPVPNSDIFIPYQPEGPTPSAVAQAEPLKWLPPNTTTTPSPMKRGELPVFSATGAIPFALASTTNGEPKRETDDMEVDIWEVPETPNRS